MCFRVELKSAPFSMFFFLGGKDFLSKIFVGSQRHGSLKLLDVFFQWIFQVLVKGGIGSIFHHPIGRKDTAYIPGIVLAFVWGLYNPKPTYYQNRSNNPLIFWNPR